MGRSFLGVFVASLITLSGATLLANEPQKQSAPLGGGAVIFFPEETKRPEDERFIVDAGRSVPVCLKLNPLHSPYLQQSLEEAWGFEIILEDNETPPNKLIVKFGPTLKEIKRARKSRKDPFYPDENGCYLTEFVVPELTRPGIYQVADLLVKTRIQDYLSLRQVLFQFTQADELDVKNPDLDQKVPELIEISSFKEQAQRLGSYGEFLRLKLEQTFFIKEEGSGAKPESLQVLYALREEGSNTSVYPAKCKRIVRTRWKFTCRLQVTRPRWQWQDSRVALVLDSIKLEDKVGNAITLKDPKAFLEKAKEEPLLFEYEGIRYGPTYTPPRPNRYQELKARWPKKP